MTDELIDDPQAGEKLLASGCRFLREGGDESLARLLASCSARVCVSTAPGIFGQQVTLRVYITAPREAYDRLTSYQGDEWTDDEGAKEIFRAIAAFVPPGVSHHVHVLAELIEPAAGWRAEYGAPTKPQDAPIPAALPGTRDDIPF
jgi:hypothetical protein